MDANPSAVARRTSPRPAPPARTRAGERAPTVSQRQHGDLMTVDPEDRRRRARDALRDLVVDQAVRRSR